MRRFFVYLLAAIAGLLAGGGIGWYVFSGTYNIAAAAPPFAIVHTALDRVYRASVAKQAEGTRAPELDEAQVTAGVPLYAANCALCHSSPGAELSPWVKGLRPMPPDLPRNGTDFDVSEIYWLVRHGSKFTATPAWQDVLTDDEIWSVAALVDEMPGISPEQYQEMLSEAEAGSGAQAEAGTEAEAEAEAEAGAEPASEAEAAAEPAATVGMTNALEFDPAEITISAGDTVRWVNDSDVPHTVTADPEKAADPDHVVLPEGAATFDSGMIQPGEEYVRTFDVPGRYKYFCIPHEAAGMIGEIVVEE